jgi:predicted ATP-grasp superfamily ATP-dependent carboligase
LIFGASTRAAAQSALRAGFRPTCADRFADEDLREVADVLVVERYPDDLGKIIDHSLACPWIYTGALENRPALLEQLAALRLLLGNPADVVRAVRDPFRLYDVLDRQGLPALAVRRTDQPPPRDGRWMLKPWRGSAGRGICVWDALAPSLHGLNEPYYFQQRAGGQPISGLFLATGGATTLIGATEQWIGRPELFAKSFIYCGSIGPIDLPEAPLSQIAQCGARIASEFGLRGLFGVDFLQENAVAWPTEVNPRYTASVEIYERTMEMPLLNWHVQACEAHPDPSKSRDLTEQFRKTVAEARSDTRRGVAAKAIVYAPFYLQTPDLVTLEKSDDFASTGIKIADRPAVDSPVAEGAPICTLIAERTAKPGLGSFQRALAALATEFERIRPKSKVQSPRSNP